MSGELSMPRILACGYRLEKTRNAPPGRRDVLFCGAKGIRNYLLIFCHFLGVSLNIWSV